MNVELHDLRIGGGLLLVAAALVPVLPGPGGVPCPLRSLTGIPCPLCGMNTQRHRRRAAGSSGRVGRHPAGVVAVLAAVGLLLFRRQVTLPVWLAVAVLASMELWQLARFDVI